MEYYRWPRRSNHKWSGIKLMVCDEVLKVHKVRPPRPIEMSGSVMNIYHIGAN